MKTNSIEEGDLNVDDHAEDHHRIDEVARNLAKEGYTETLNTKNKKTTDLLAESLKLKDVLQILEDEFEDMRHKYKELVTRYETITDESTRPNLNSSVKGKSLRQVGDALRDIIQEMDSKVIINLMWIVYFITFIITSGRANIYYKRHHQIFIRLWL